MVLGEKTDCNEEKNQKNKKNIGNIDLGALSYQEINKIIGTDKTTTKEADKDKQMEIQANTSSPSIQGTSKNNCSENLETLAEFTDVFKPKRTVVRTPPNSEEKQPLSLKEKEVRTPYTVSTKRSRSNSSPEMMERQKIRKDEEKSTTEKDPQAKQIETTENPRENVEYESSIQESLAVTLGALETIIEHSEKQEIQAEDGRIIRYASFLIHKVVTNLAYKIGEVQVDNLKLSNEIVSLKTALLKAGSLPSNVCNTTIAEKKPNSTSQRTYSNVLNKGNPVGNQVQQWKTPPQTRKLETMVKIKDLNDSKQVVKQIKENITSSNQNTGSFKSIKHLQSGSVIIECENENQQKKLRDILMKNRTIDVKELQNTDPMILLCGIEKGYNSKEVIDIVIEENPELSALGNDVQSSIKVITKKDCRNRRKENWVLQTKPEIFRALIKKEKINFDLSKVFVKEYFNIPMCFNCCYFGHIAKHCQSEHCCHKCGKRHDKELCQESDQLDCPNCKRLNLKDRVHSARDPRCPVFIQKLEKYRQSTDYGTSDKAENFLAINQSRTKTMSSV